MPTDKLNNERNSIPEMLTSRLRLRPMALQDAEAFLRIFSDIKTLEYWSFSPISTLSEAENLIRRELGIAESGSGLPWGVALRDSDELIGKFTLFQFSDQNRRAEVGYILDRRHWNKGYMSEAMARMIDHAFNDLNLNRLEADTDPGNTASLALLERFGFRREGLFRQRWLVHGKWHDSVMLGLLRGDWEASRRDGEA